MYDKIKVIKNQMCLYWNIITKNYGYYTNSVFGYFANFALSLPTSHLNQIAKNIVESLQNNVNKINNLRIQGYEYSAEEKPKKLLPSL